MDDTWLPKHLAFDELEKVQPHYNWHLKDRLTQAQIVSDGLVLNPVLENTYNFMQDMRQALKEKDTDKLQASLKQAEKLGEQMKITRLTLNVI